MRIFKNIYLSNRFYYFLASISALFAISFIWPLIFPFSQLLLLLFILLVGAEILVLFLMDISIQAERKLTKVLSLGDDNPITLFLKNTGSISVYVNIYEEVPFQFQERDFHFSTYLKSNESKHFNYFLKPLYRGVYSFGNIQLYISSQIGFVLKKSTIISFKDVPVYPSLIQMRKYEIINLPQLSREFGSKKMRKIGYSYEFEQIKNYIKGDDYRKINWKATGKKSELMVNQYIEERSQQIFCVLDNSRSMYMPFNGMSLFDYAVNTSLVISNVAIHKYDKVGFMSFSKEIDHFLPPDNRKMQLSKILDILYKQEDKTWEANYEKLYHYFQKKVTHRSLVFLFTNFDSTYSLERVQHILSRLNKMHVLVVVFFENTELNEFSKNYNTQSPKEIFETTLAQKKSTDRWLMTTGLRKLGIQTILTEPEQLSINVINKYLEIKARGLI